MFLKSSLKFFLKNYMCIYNYHQNVDCQCSRSNTIIHEIYAFDFFKVSRLILLGKVYMHHKPLILKVIIYFEKVNKISLLILEESHPKYITYVHL